MNEQQIPTPTDAELEILQALWAKHPESVRYVNDLINSRRNPEQHVGYTTTLKQMQVMMEKGLLTREIIERNHLYSPAQEQKETQAQVVQELADLAFEGSAYSLVLRALGSGQTTPEEMAKIKAFIQEIEQQKQ
jgi:predicted transcriptional regulator